MKWKRLFPKRFFDLFLSPKGEYKEEGFQEKL